MPTAGTLILSAVLEGIAMATATDRAFKALRPLDAVKIFHTSFLVREALNELGETQHLFLGHSEHLPRLPLVSVYLIKCPIKRTKSQHLVLC